MARRHPLLFWFLVVAFVCALGMATFDPVVAWYCKRHVGGAVEAFFRAVTTLGEGGFWYAAAGLVLAGNWLLAVREGTTERGHRLRCHARSAWFMIASMAASGLVLSLTKFSLGRYRPRALFDSGLYGFDPFSTHWAMNSFPSGHSQTIWSAMIALSFLFPRYRTAFLATAVLVSLSRVVLSVHYPSDVLMGSYLGIAVTLWLRRRFEARGLTLSISPSASDCGRKC
ncbi:MAG: phosphatase PAP2 family protein [Alphaproteobacteria bacterium]